jgi:MYXO-CTERM domain-containing protein
MGNDNCATGEYCTKTDGTVGTCMTEPCNQSSDCSAPTPVCDTIVQPHVCVQCLIDSDCPPSMVCDATHCVQCTSTNPKSCMGNPNGSVCLQGNTCGCTMDSDCGGPTSGQVCDMSTNKCEAGCRGTGGNGCPPPQVCSSKDSSIGTCEGATTSSSASASSSASGAGGAGGSGAAGAGGSGGGNLVAQSIGCGCRVAASGDEGAVALGGILAALALLLRRRAQHPSPEVNQRGAASGPTPRAPAEP